MAPRGRELGVEKYSVALVGFRTKKGEFETSFKNT